MLGKIEGRRRRGRQRIGWLDGITDAMDMSLSELRKMVMNKEVWRAAIHGVTKSRTWLNDWTELNWTDMNQPWVYTCSPSWTPLQPPPNPIPQGHPSTPALSTLSHALNLDWRSVSYMIIHMFQCSSLRSSHPHLFPQSPKVCSLPLCLFCWLAYKVIITIFLNSL